MRKGKSSVRSGVVTEMMLASDDAGLKRMASLVNCILKEKGISPEWDTSATVNCFKHKGEAKERENNRGLKLLEHTMKIFERALEKEIRKVIDVSEIAVWIYAWKWNYRCHFIACTLLEKYLGKKNLYFFFVDLEKAFDRVPRGVLRWAMRNLNVDEWLIEITNNHGYVRI